eukprot:1151581-Pelagomonas_calceolata.AAC.6
MLAHAYKDTRGYKELQGRGQQPDTLADMLPLFTRALVLLFHLPLLSWIALTFAISNAHLQCNHCSTGSSGVREACRTESLQSPEGIAFVNGALFVLVSEQRHSLLQQMFAFLQVVNSQSSLLPPR